MATPPRPRPTRYQRLKRAVDAQLSGISRRIGRLGQGDTIDIEPGLVPRIQPQPVNADLLPDVFQQGFANIYSEVIPNLIERVFHLRQVQVTWHGVVLRKLRVFVPSLPQPWMETEFAGLFLFRQFRAKRIPELSHSPVGLAFDSWSGNYFHWMAEVLPRLALLRKVQPECTVLLPGPNPPAYVTESVRALGFKRTHVVNPGELVVVPDLYMPVRPGRHGYMVPQLTHDVQQAIFKHYAEILKDAKPASRRTYVSRSRQQWRFLTNESEAWSIMRRYGFEMVFFEDLSFVEQVRIMYETDILVGIHGANMTNLLFMTPGSHVLELMSPTYVNPSYLSMANSVGINYWLVPSLLGSPLNVEHNYADITADLTVLENILSQACTQSRTQSTSDTSES